MKKAFIISMVMVLLMSALSVGISVASNAVAAPPCDAGTPDTPNPANSSTSVSMDTSALSWSNCSNASSYQVYFDTNASSLSLIASPATNSSTMPTLSINTTYYWKVVAFNGSTCNTSDNSSLWNFTTECPFPGTPGSPAPANLSTSVSVNADLNWGDSLYADSYDVYFGTNASALALNSSSSTSALALPPLNYSTTYYWKVVANGCSVSTNGSIWSFTTAAAPVCPVPSMPGNESPANTSTAVSLDADLSWGNCTDATSYQVLFGTSETALSTIALPSSNSCVLTPLNACTTYYWKVYSVNSCSNNSSPVWRFTTASSLPTAPGLASPANASTGVSTNTSIDWTDSLYASYYYVYFGTNPSALDLQGNTTVSNWPLSNLSASATYYWSIVAFGPCGFNNSATWTFSTSGCVMTDTPSTPSPGNLSTNVSVDADLDWTNSSYATYYQVYFGTSSTPTALVGSPNASNLTLTRLSANTTYYWKVVARNACNSSTGSIWSFTTECANVSKPQLTSPVNASTNQSISITLNWSAVANASLYDVYLSTNSTPTIHGNTSNSSYQATLSNYSTKYYWKIVAKNNCGNNSSDIWEFTTGVAPAVTPTATATRTPTPTPTASAGTGTISVTLNTSSSGVLQQAVDVTSSNNQIRLRMPAGGTALNSAGQPIQVITMSVTEEHPAPQEDRIVIAAFNFSPSGASFHPYITITLDYTNDMIPADVNESALVIAFYNDSTSGWEYLTNGVINTDADTITFTVDHFTVFSIQTPPIQHGGGLATWVIIVIVFGDAVVLGLIVGLYIKYRRVYGRMAPEGDEGDAYDEYNDDGADQGGDEDFKF